MPESIDRLSGLLEKFRVRAHLFHNGPLCGLTHFADRPGRGFLHVMRSGEMQVSHRDGPVPAHLWVREPSLLFYPRPLAHDFHHAPAEGSDFICATLDFEGGDRHPLVRGLPALIHLPLKEIDGIGHTLELLFGEADRVRCGHRLLADRLFEVLLIQMLRWLFDHPERSGLSDGLLPGFADPRLARLLVALHDDPGRDWRLERMAAIAGMSRSAFAAHFKNVLGQTPMAYLTGWRLSLAQKALLADRPVKAIACDLGYANASALSRVFAQNLGLSPRGWLKRQASGADAGA